MLVSDFLETFEGRIVGAAERDVYDVVLIEEGLSKNGNYYPREVLQRALPLFENAKCFAFEFLGNVYDHLPENIKRAVPQGFARNLVGYFTNPVLTEVRPGVHGVKAKFHVVASWAKDLLSNLAKEGRLSKLLGFSIDARGSVTREGNQLKVESIDALDSVDLVTHPAAGGRFLEGVYRLAASRVAESLGLRERGVMDMYDRMLLMLKGALKEGAEELEESLVKAVFSEAFEEDELAELLEELKEVAARCLRDLQEGREDIARAYLEAFVEAKRKRKRKKQKEYPYPSPEYYPAPAKASEPVIPKEAQEALERAKALEERLHRMELERYLTEALSGSGLSQAAQEHLRRRSYSSKEEVDRAIAEMKDLEAAYVRESGVSTPSVEVEQDETDKLLKMIDDAVEGKASIREAYIRWTGDTRVTGLVRNCYEQGRKRITEALTSSDWAEVLGDSIRRKMLQEYNAPNLQDWRLIVSDVVPVPDFRTQRWLRIGGYGSLPEVAEGADYSNLTSPGDQEVTMAVKKHGGFESVTLEMIKNDDLLAIKQIPRKLARAAARTLHRAIFNDILAGNPEIYDTLQLFCAAHGNLGNQALSQSSFMQARVAMAKQTAYGASEETLNLYPRWLVVPPDLEEIAFKLCNSRVTVVANENATTPNIVPTKFQTDYIVVPYWTDANDWVAVCDPKDCPTIIVGFLDGREEPELFIQDQPNVGSMFTADKITYKIRHVWGVMVADYRGFYKGVVS